MENTDSQKEAERQRAKAIAHEILKGNRTDTAHKRVRASRNTLFVLSGLFFLYAVLYGAGLLADDIASLVIYGVIGIIYIGLGMWAKTNPKFAAILGLGIYLLTIALIGLIDPSTLYKGLLIKTIIIIYLVRGIFEANKIPKKAAVETNTLDGNMLQ